ncbi:positive regulator of sigma(E), RseC/MucC [Psychromonas ingrahamii 37]|uniref:Positive regulator of sigma(E), RseC/MucC n=1 Tax=Psychromonas ingrahamii (strain DSM 17664 / CCUG 51855 / 37) TaxID=357804 RepID=A1SR27_PSYIN|nr:SoxR reducing system RseC family protein [Psychromonas ingrahamii]ABM01942.1 positive regulator of sigma(E), RseC/MucC [Psychromonas ingrahamii 37]
MVAEKGKIIAIEKSEGKTLAHIEYISKSACSSCQNNDTCGVGVVSKTFSDKALQFTIPYAKEMEVDKFVELNISNNDLIKSAMLVYLVPLLFFITSALIAKQFNITNEAIIILIAISWAAAGFVITHFVTKKLYPQKSINQLISSKTIQ